MMLLMLGASYDSVDRPAPSESEAGVMPASSRLRFVRRVPEKGPPEAFTLHSDSYVTPEVFIEQYSAALWELSKLDELRLVSSLKDRNGYVAEFYKQFHAGYPVESGQFTLMISANRKVVSAIGNPVGRLDGIPTEVRVSEGSAVEQARRKAVAACSLREPLTFMKTPAARLMVSENHRRLVWQVPVGVAEPKWIEWTVEIDALTGEVLKQWGGVGVNGEMPGCSSAM
jgi:Zn-dependent metalloprotease